MSFPSEKLLEYLRDGARVGLAPGSDVTPLYGGQSLHEGAVLYQRVPTVKPKTSDEAGNNSAGRGAADEVEDGAGGGGLLGFGRKPLHDFLEYDQACDSVDAAPIEAQHSPYRKGCTGFVVDALETPSLRGRQVRGVVAAQLKL